MGGRLHRWGWRRWVCSGLVGLVLLVAAAEAAINLGQLDGRGLSFVYQQGYSLQDGWLCYGWPNGDYHCTRYWSWIDGVATSKNPSYVPNYDNRPTMAQGGTNDGQVLSAAPGGISQWANTGDPSWQLTDYSAWQGNKSALVYPFGQCTWFAAYTGGGNLTWMGDAADWLATARSRGLATGTTPQVGATVVFQPFVQGASGLGHVAHVVAVYGNTGWFKVEEMNFYINGGGWGRVDYRFVHTGWGTDFVYS